MPKISKHGGVSYAGSEGDEQPSDGNSSTPSPKRRGTSRKTSEDGPQRRARTTENRSTKGRTAGADAGSTAGGGPKTQDSDDSSKND